MARTKLIISVILLFATSSVSGQWWWPPTDGVEIVPEHPSSSDLVNITLGGEWPNSCRPEASSISFVGNDIYFYVIAPPQDWCFTVIVGWVLTEEAGPLEPGSYSLYAILASDGLPLPPPDPLYPLIAEFTVRPSGDIDITYRVDFLDYALLAEAWMSEPNDGNWDAACDISEPNDDIIDGRDLGVLGENWLESVPGITFEIEDCDMLGNASGVLEGLRFSVWVEGDYIHFEDMMVANCCPERLWLEMVTGDSLIIINEKESGGMCLCTCDWPVTARFGPFEDGVYTVEVYEDHGGFIGRTTVEIGEG